MIKLALRRVSSRGVCQLTNDEQRLLDSFRRAWEDHDVWHLNKIFSDKVDYRFGVNKRFNSKGSLIRYWCVNYLTQRSNKVKIYDSIRVGKVIKFKFVCSFYNPLRSVFTSVSGQVSLEVNSSGKIYSFWQSSEKVETISRFYNVEIFIRVFVAPIYGILKRFSRAFMFYLTPISIFAIYVLFILGTSAVLYEKFWPIDRELLPDGIRSDLKTFSAYSFIGGFVLQQLVAYLKARRLSSVRFSAVNSEKDDIKLIRKNITGADSVTIVSGDFSFIEKDKELSRILKGLAYDRKLTLISYKSRQKVMEELGTRSAGNDIAQKLISDGSFKFDFPIKTKLTIVGHGVSKRVLIRYWKDVHGHPQQYIGVFRDTDDVRPLLTALSDLVDGVYN